MKLAVLAASIEPLILDSYPDMEVFFPDPRIMIIKGGPDPSEIDGATHHALNENGWAHSAARESVALSDCVVLRPYPFWYLLL